MLSARAVAYINLDIAVEGNVTMMCHGIPSLSDVAYNAAKFVRKRFFVCLHMLEVYTELLSTACDDYNVKP